MDLSRIAAISFDLDDTLWPFLPCLVRAEGVLTQWLIENAPATSAVLHSPAALRPYRDKAVESHPHLRHDLSELRRMAIRELLDEVGEDAALAEAAAFHAAAALAGVAPSQLLHVGDDWALDVVGALNAGAQAAWLVRGDDEPPAPAPGAQHTVIRDVAMLCDMLACPP